MNVHGCVVKMMHGVYRTAYIIGANLLDEAQIWDHVCCAHLIVYFYFYFVCRHVWLTSHTLSNGLLQINSPSSWNAGVQISTVTCCLIQLLTQPVEYQTVSKSPQSSYYNIFYHFEFVAVTSQVSSCLHYGNIILINWCIHHSNGHDKCDTLDVYYISKMFL